MRGQKQTPQPASDTGSGQSANKSRNVLTTILVGLALFVIGINVGNGTIPLPTKSAANGDLPATLDYASVTEVYRMLKQHYNGKLTEEQLLDGLKHGLVNAADDPYTTYLTKSENEELTKDLNNTFSGIGAQLGKDDKGTIEVIAPIKGTPAERAGVQAQDKITSIDGKTTVGLSIDDAVTLIRGATGTKVKLQIVRGDAVVTLEITRENIQIPSVEHEIIDGSTGLLTINSFAPDTSKLVDTAADEFKQAGIKNIILDLRNNPGGEVDAAVSTASQWLPQGALVLQEKRGNTVLKSYESTGPSKLQGIPTAILVNEGSASAAEIMATALKDNKQGYIIGQKTYGKGVVQSIIGLSNGSAIKVTTSAWHRPNGQNINHKGVSPDKTVELTEEQVKAGIDSQLDAAKAYLKQ